MGNGYLAKLSDPALWGKRMRAWMRSPVIDDKLIPRWRTKKSGRQTHRKLSEPTL
ncbi:hypothetical protein [Laspinema olomoucense]|uniref:hypothetical protein n=1 Tax=Laspinema olomoucense TaxID=3231600 RepID=UPI0021BA98F2|nr:hypothetical protein [Laspinema sp. D3d]MCT7975221.1 hypothetical protein [Laspinema sp. D3d]